MLGLWLLSPKSGRCIMNVFLLYISKLLTRKGKRHIIWDWLKKVIYFLFSEKRFSEWNSGVRNGRPSVCPVCLHCSREGCELGRVESAGIQILLQQDMERHQTGCRTSQSTWQWRDVYTSRYIGSTFRGIALNGWQMTITINVSSIQLIFVLFSLNIKGMTLVPIIEQAMDEKDQFSGENLLNAVFVAFRINISADTTKMRVFNNGTRRLLSVFQDGKSWILKITNNRELKIIKAFELVTLYYRKRFVAKF